MMQVKFVASLSKLHWNKTLSLVRNTYEGEILDNTWINIVLFLWSVGRA